MSNTAKNTGSVIIESTSQKQLSIQDFLDEQSIRDGRYDIRDDYFLVFACDLFQQPEMDPEMIIPVFKMETSFRAELNKDYVPNPVVLENVVKLLVDTDIQLSLCLKGESGSGKTELAMYISHMMNWPLTIKQINSNIRADELEGERSLIDGNTGFVYSDLVQGFKDGHLILLDEIDKIDPDTAAKLHMPIERKPWSVSANGGEVIKPHAFTRFLGTANTNMSGGERRFVSSQRQDAAFTKRFLIIEMEKPDAVFFTRLLSKRYPDFSMGILEKFVKVAIAVNDAGAEDSVMDARQLVAWVSTSKALSNLAIKETFKIAFATGLPSHIYETVMEAMDLTLGREKEFTMSYLTAARVTIENQVYKVIDLNLMNYPIQEIIYFKSNVKEEYIAVCYESGSRAHVLKTVSKDYSYYKLEDPMKSKNEFADAMARNNFTYAGMLKIAEVSEIFKGRIVADF
ncbi:MULTISPECIES: ATP-binding protein [Buttiauxella]|jgi:cobaltochelatase CobS|uniref:AAA ATPase containing von Willebrand factor type A (VWA) domain n=1 Tax=Buttiauxella agrestis TaxID=82977 RepID=A0A381KP51_9ENTR|nr:AAA family ATPase [Buttiauxella agrestis]SUY92782.1 AAA ATPase containing von Willebrand factor type A (vWA) domain [Buttiauxella agrestis]